MLTHYRTGALARIVVAAAAIMFVYGCASPEPAPSYPPAPSAFDRAWSAAINAAQDEGVKITAEDRASGMISGSRGEQQITIYVRTQADGNVRLEFSVRGPKGATRDWRAEFRGLMTGGWDDESGTDMVCKSVAP